MLHLPRLLTILVLVALVVSACQPIQLVAPAIQGQPHQPRPDAPPYAVRGSYPVGVRDFVINTPDRPIAVSVWYPALNPAAKPEAVTYTLDFPTNDFPAFTVTGRALRDAEPDYANWSLSAAAAYPCRLVNASGNGLLGRASGVVWLCGHCPRDDR